MNKFRFIFLVFFASFFLEASQACPCGVGYKYFYVISASGIDKNEVINQGESISRKTGHKFISKGISIESRLEQCEGVFDKCLILMSSDEESIGKGSLTNVKQDSKVKTFAVAYAFRSFDSKKNEMKASQLLKKIRTFVKDAYLKKMEACACE